MGAGPVQEARGRRAAGRARGRERGERVPLGAPPARRRESRARAALAREAVSRLQYVRAARASASAARRSPPQPAGPPPPGAPVSWPAAAAARACRDSAQQPPRVRGPPAGVRECPADEPCAGPAAESRLCSGPREAAPATPPVSLPAAQPPHHQHRMLAPLTRWRRAAPLVLGNALAAAQCADASAHAASRLCKLPHGIFHCSHLQLIVVRLVDAPSGMSIIRERLLLDRLVFIVFTMLGELNFM